jgi:hypothetical protein
MVQKSRVRWLAAELMVVVLGVLIAFAADGWREDLQQVQEERLYLDRLSEDLDATLNMFQFAQGRLERARDATLTLIDIQEAGEGRSSVDPDSLAALYIRSTDIEWVPSIFERGATYRELVASGRLQLLRDRVLRGRLVFFYRGLDDLGVDIVNMYDAGLRDRIASLTGYRPYRLTSQSVLSVPGVGLSDENQRRLLDAMRDSPPPVADLRRMHGALDDQGVVVTGLVMALQSLLERLGAGAGSV